MVSAHRNRGRPNCEDTASSIPAPCDVHAEWLCGGSQRSQAESAAALCIKGDGWRRDLDQTGVDAFHLEGALEAVGHTHEACGTACLAIGVQRWRSEPASFWSSMASSKGSLRPTTSRRSTVAGVGLVNTILSSESSRAASSSDILDRSVRTAQKILRDLTSACVASLQWLCAS